jgi:hypothetical protein
MRIRIFLAAALGAALLPAPPAPAQATAIAFLNPSGYSSTNQSQPRLLSAKPDADSTYHLVAWVKNPPPSPLVEFELRPTAPGSNSITVTASRAGNTWEYDLDLSGVPDGSYTLAALLYSGLNPVGQDEQLVTVNNQELPPPDAANTVELLYPRNAGRAGYFTPAGKSSGFVVQAIASAGTSQVRFLYSTSDPGTAPEWRQCAAGRPNADRIVIARCAVAAGDSPARVSAIAAVSSRQPTGDPQPAADESGDAHHVVPFEQVPRIVEVSPDTASRDPGGCQKFTLTVTDQDGRAIAGVNVDVHATGPSDQLQFATVDTAVPGVNETDPFQPPDRGHSTENARRCSNAESLGRQGETNRPGGDDEKHIESTSPATSLGGTDNTGDWDFALYSGSAGGTRISAWADVNDDDVASLAEASGGAQMGWGQAPPPPVDEIFVSNGQPSATTGSCVPIEVYVRRGNNPLGGANVDVHLTGPDAAVTFCQVSGGAAPTPPDGGGHVGDTHEDATRHGEGVTDAAGRFVFGVTSSTPGASTIQAWFDSSDDDVLAGEPSASTTVTWQPPGERSVTIQSNKGSVAKGRRVRLSGEIDGDPACEGGQQVSIQAKPVRGGRFGTVRTATTDGDGNYSASIRMRKSRKFRATVPSTGSCSAARSGTITVRVRR